MEHICSYCSLQFDTGPKLGSHKRNCQLNPNRASRIQRIAESNTRPRLTYNFTCEKCGTPFQLELRSTQLKQKNCGRFCSRSCANIRVHSSESKQKIAATLAGKATPRTCTCKYCGVSLPPRRSACRPRCHAMKTAISASLSEALKGKTGGYRERGGRGKGSHYKEVWLDSTWELAFVKRLDQLSIRWERDVGKHRFPYVDSLGRERLYFPDFYLPEFECYVEVKGYWTSIVKQKIDAAVSRNQFKLIVIDSLEAIQSITIDSLRG